MTQKLDTLEAALKSALGDTIKSLVRDRGEITITDYPRLIDYAELPQRAERDISWIPARTE